MNKKLNKLVTNYPVNLTEEEIENLSATLAPVVAACGGGGGTGGKIYTGMDFVNVNNSTNQIGLTEAAKTKLNQDIPTKVSDLSDSANYQTVAGMDEYLTTGAAQDTYLTKSDAENGYAPIGTYTDVQTLKNQIQNVYTKSETSASNELSTEFDSLSAKYQEKGSYASQQSVQTLTLQVQNKQDKLTFGYDENNAISSIDGTALAGQGGTTYTPGQYINIDSNNEISVTGVVASDEYATYSGDWNDVSNSYKTNSGSFLTIEDLTNYYPKTQTSSDSELAEAFGSILKYDVTAAAGIQVITATDAGVKTYGISMTAQPVVTDTRLSGYNGIAAEPDGNVSGLWDVGLTQDMLNKINGKLDSTAAAQTYLEKSTYTNASGKWENASNVVVTNSADWNAKVDQDDLDDYLTKEQYGTDSATFALKNDLYEYYTKTDTSSKDELSTEFAKYQVTGDYATKSDISDMATKTWVGQQGFYTKASGDNDYAPKSVTATINTLTGASAGWNEVTSKLGTAQYATDSATFVTSSNSTITGTKQYALTTVGWAEVQVGASLTASSGINIDNNLINVTLGRNLKFDTYSSVTTEDDLSATSYRAGKYDNQYTIVNKYGLETYFSSAPDSAKLTLSTNGLNNTLEGGNRSITANYDLNHLFFKSYDNTGTYSGNYSQVEVKVMQETAPEETQHRSSITLTDYYGGVEHTGLITVEKIAQWDQGGGTSFTGVTTAGSISGDGLTNPLGLKTSAEQALTSVSNKVDKPDTTQTVLNNNYLIYSTLTGAGTTTGWMPLSANYYSKSETNGTFVATANIDTITLSGDGKSVSTKLGVKTDVIATRDFVNSSFLPTSGGTVSGQLVVSGGSTFDSENLKFIRTGQNGYGRIGLASNGALAVKVDDSNSNTTQINVAANASYNELIQVQHGGTTAYLIPAVTANTTAGLTNDGILHIILES